MGNDSRQPNSPTILLVEDALDLAQLIRGELETAGYQVLYAPDGPQALDLHAEHQPDLVILDWMLPTLDGLAVLRHIRATAPTPVLMLTARSTEVDRVVGLEVGADDYLTKPFSMRELIARVHSLLRRIAHVQQILSADRQQTHDTLTYGLLRLVPDMHQATLDGHVLDLTRIEFGLLHLLVRNPGRVFSRQYLIETVWGDQYVTGDRAVDNVVLRLRKKLGPVGETIETVWGLGYRLKSTI